MEIEIRRIYTQVDDIYAEGAVKVEKPLRKAAVVFVIKNPLCHSKGADLSSLIEVSPEIGKLMGQKLLEVMNGFPIEGYGKGGLVGSGGEAEHANALLTTAFANPIREAIGGADAWISSFQKLAVPGDKIDIPMNHKDDVYVRSHYDGMTVSIAGCPQADEVALIFCASSGKRLNWRVGGLTHEEVMARKIKG
ncbi:hypothetical protein L579_4195 [Pantoea sp. AS-PWVM4]|uniref:amino acid synthesis family protein n=1 Tax=Pantoea sp. AS-PWVM4 TaxID=1332069 RepID=UPI0003AC843B|nr:amino acid synthesis family protein [Pantoea sp. AS-PWVM4]ERK16287.1 hypothetical protein L579_4195 [Pantoea sp. AS-PWVM4]